jgi:hypothetical protein
MSPAPHRRRISDLACTPPAREQIAKVALVGVLNGAQ